MQETRWFLSALLLMFIGLKLGHIIEWSWWWVLSPFWIPLLIALVVQTLVWVYYRWFETEHDRNSRQLIEALRELSNRFR